MIENDCRCPGCGNCGAEIAVERLTKEREDLNKSLREARKSLREAKQKYAELSRILQAAERERDEAYVEIQKLRAERRQLAYAAGRSDARSESKLELHPFLKDASLERACEPQAAIQVDAGDIAVWLEAQPAEKLWTVDGEDTLAGAISFPCAGDELASLVRTLGRLRVFSSAEAVRAYEESHDLASLGQDEGSGIVFAVGGAADDAPRWLLVEDTLAESARAATI